MSNYRNIEDYSRAFKALSNPHRLKIFLRLLNCCPPGTVCGVDEASRFSVGDLGDDLNVAPSTLSHHIKELNNAGLLQMERRGQHVDCWLDPARVQSLRELFESTSSTE